MIGIVVVTWNSADVIGDCLDACAQFGDVEVVVVDNASSDNTVDVVRSRPSVRLMANTQNRGFAAAVNQGVGALGCPAVLLLNPDAAPTTRLDSLARAVEAPGVGAAGGRLIDQAGQTQDGFNVRSFPTPLTLAFEVLGLNRLFPWNPVNRSYRLRLSHEADVDQPAAAFLMVNREVWGAVGGLDEGFWPAWFEDVDFCLRLRLAGYRIRYVPEACATHVGGHSATYLSWESRQLFWYGSLLRYSGKHFRALGRRVVAGALMVACVPRALIGMMAESRLGATGVYSKVFRLALDCWHEPLRPQSLSCESIASEGEKRPL
jgi:N-acetylglucosaminyl-diphospho-decaprenol L-rhamnosyltransferase